MERLIKERELDRVDLANLSREYEEKNLEIKRLQAECATVSEKSFLCRNHFKYNCISRCFLLVFAANAIIRGRQ